MGRAASLPSQNQVGPAPRAFSAHHALLIEAEPIGRLAAAHAQDVADAGLPAQQRLAPRDPTSRYPPGNEIARAAVAINAVSSTMSPNAPHRPPADARVRLGARAWSGCGREGQAIAAVAAAARPATGRTRRCEAHIAPAAEAVIRDASTTETTRPAESSTKWRRHASDPTSRRQTARARTIMR
jgi:hypothetical protein